MKHTVGDGNKIHLWHDNWHPHGLLLLKYNMRTMYDMGLPINSKLSVVIHETEWVWPPARFDDKVEIQTLLFEIPTP